MTTIGTTPSGNWRQRLFPWLMVLAILVFVGGIRIRLLDLPLERDEGEYAYAGQLILQGIPPYELAYNMKLPGTYYVYAAGMRLFGQTAAGIHLTLLVVNALTCVFVFLLGRELAGTTAGMAACAVYALLSLSPAVLGVAAHATQFVVLFATPGIWLLTQALAGGRTRTFCLAGLLFGLAFLMKQPGLCFGLFGFAMLLSQACWRGSLFDRRFRLALAGYSAGVALPFGLFCLLAWSCGLFGRFWFWTFHYAAAYGTSNSLLDGFDSLAGYLQGSLSTYAGFFVLAVAGLLGMLQLLERFAPGSGEAAAVTRANRHRSAMYFLLALFFFSVLGTSVGTYFRQHYFVLLLPAFALLVGVSVESLSFLSPRRMRLAPVGLLLILLAVNVWQQRRVYFQMPPLAVCQSLYPGNPFADSLPVARYIREHSPPDARIAVLGSEPQIYFYAGRHSATGYIYTYPLMESQRYARTMQQEMIHEIEMARPEYLVIVQSHFSWLKQDQSDLSILQWAGRYADQYYVPVIPQGWSDSALVLMQRKRE